MAMQLTIGDFARITHLSVKTLRHYHQVGLLEPVQIDPGSGYRYYDTDQVPTAQVIKRFRNLGMPVDEVKAVLSIPANIATFALMPIGYPTGKYGPVTRKPVAEVAYADRWGNAWPAQADGKQA